MKNSWKFLFICAGILCVLGFAAPDIQAAPPGKIVFTPAGADPVTFDHETHKAMKCNECHTKIFKMKKGTAKLTKEDHAKEVSCGVCHNGKKAFAQTTDADCAKCHKK
jgi:c(7)-type cytochrome triheme protein